MERYSGYIMKLTPWKESDYILKVLTEEVGVITVYVKNGATSKKRFSGILDLYLFNEFDLTETNQNNFFFLKEARTLEPYISIHKTPEKLYITQYMNELFTNIMDVGEWDSNGFQTFHKLINWIEKEEIITEKHLLFLKFVFINSSGYLPEIKCSICKETFMERSLYFSFENFLFSCANHPKSDFEITKKMGIMLIMSQNNSFISQLDLTKNEISNLNQMFERLYSNFIGKPIISDKLVNEIFN
ncbi:DNA repair protein RecO [bacterium]|nr:DNA repair protein RecO [bacterium]